MGLRKKAIEEGRQFYWNGKPCPKGHFDYRYTSTGTCVSCMRAVARSEERRKYDKEYNTKNRDYRLRAARNRYYANRESHLKECAEWVRKNPEKSRAIKKSYKYRRRAKEKQGVSGKELNNWESEQIKACYWCGVKCPNNYHVDHYYPLTKGGKHELDNLVIACPSCNMTKSNKDPYEYANQVGRLF